MQTYIGYGFDTNDIGAETWASLVKKYDSDAYKEINKKAAMLSNSEEVQEIMIDYALDFIDENSMDKTEYLSRIINSEESESAGTDYIVSAYDNFLVFDSVRFADDSKRTKYIKTQEDFINMIARYIPIDEIQFGNPYEGVEWIDPCFFIE